jgi:hypothetical protein
LLLKKLTVTVGEGSYENHLLFSARLTRASISDFCHWGFWTLCDVLEDEPDPRARTYQYFGLSLDRRIPLAAKWVEIAGDELWMTEEDPDGDGGWKLWEGKKCGFLVERWQFWKSRFQMVEELCMASVETRKLARETRERMKRIETVESHEV